MCTGLMLCYAIDPGLILSAYKCPPNPLLGENHIIKAILNVLYKSNDHAV